MACRAARLQPDAWISSCRRKASRGRSSASVCTPTWARRIIRRRVAGASVTKTCSRSSHCCATPPKSTSPTSQRSTINRRIARRMVLHKISSLRQYLKHLHENRTEIMALCEDLLIHVTSFFREPDAFRALKDIVLPRIFRNKAPNEPFRVWGGRAAPRARRFTRSPSRCWSICINTRVPYRFKSSGPTSARRSSNKPGRESIRKAPCRPSPRRARANSSSALTAGTRS